MRLFVLFVACVVFGGELGHLFTTMLRSTKPFKSDIIPFLSHQSQKGVMNEKDKIITNNIHNKEKHEIGKNISISESQPSSFNCSLKVINKHMLDHGWFPGTGEWTKCGMCESVGYPYAHYITPHCQLLPPWSPITYDYLRQPYRPNTIVIHGDSQGARFNKALITLLTKYAGYECRLVRKEPRGMPVRDNYYRHQLGYMNEIPLIFKRTCLVCSSCFTQCVNNETEHELSLEFISLEILHRIHPWNDTSYCKEKKHQDEGICTTSFKTQEEFLFRVYFKDRFPDLLIMATTFGHTVSANQTRNYVKNSLSFLHQLIDKSAVRNSTIVWLPTTYVDTALFEDDRKYGRYEDGVNFTQQVDALNHELFKTLSRRLRKGDRRNYGFLDIFHMSKNREIRKAWALDHIHLKPNFYKAVIAYLLQALHHTFTKQITYK